MEQKISDRVFLTGCDHKTEWQLPWFLKNFKKQLNKTKIVSQERGGTNHSPNQSIISQ